MGAPLVSVCIPAYRGAHLLPATIESVLAQTLREFELVIIDDASPDATADVVARYRDPRVRYLRNAANLGPEGNWNRCLAEARGRYLKLLPQDDLLQPACLARQVAVLEQDRDERIALVFCSRRVITASGQPVLVRGYRGRPEGIVPAQQLVRACVRRGTTVIGEPGAALFRRSLAQRTGGFDATDPYVIDLDYFFRLLLAGDGYYLPEPLVSFRVSRQAWSVTIGRRQSAHFSRFVRRASREPRHAIGRLDRALASIMAPVNNLLRLLFYRIFPA